MDKYGGSENWDLGERVSELTKAIMEWWKEHQFDTTGEHGDYNVYSDEPDFVSIARELDGQIKDTNKEKDEGDSSNRN